MAAPAATEGTDTSSGNRNINLNAQTGIFDGLPGGVDGRSSAAAKVGFFRSLFAARTDVYAVRWVTPGRASRGGCRQYLPLTDEVITAHLAGEIDVGLYPLLDGDRT
jgi:hypothetical protein